MKRGSDKHGAMADDELQSETEALERSGKDPHVEEHLARDGLEEDEPGDPLAGTHSSAPHHPNRNEGETGGSSHPKPKEDS
ncbi:MAG: hypothetical protein GEU68_09970 [Actinobacteria bacterium]|nr:hypothetical protein [Actinomycetota bacterium]